MMQSLDGYVAGVEGELGAFHPPNIALFRYWIDHVRDLNVAQTFTVLTCNIKGTTDFTEISAVGTGATNNRN